MVSTSIPIRNQVNISQQRIGTPLISGNNRLSPQQILRNQQQQAQLAQQQQQQLTQQPIPQSHQSLTTQQIQHAIAQLQAQTAAAAAAAGQTTASVNGTGAAHLSPPFGARDATSSPQINNNGLTNSVSSPRPPSTQPQTQVSVPVQSQLPRATNVQGHYYLPNYTQEQLQNALRMQAMQQVQVQQQQQQQAQQQQQQQNQQHS